MYLHPFLFVDVWVGCILYSIDLYRGVSMVTMTPN